MIQKKIHWLGITVVNNEIKDILKVIKSLENTGILSKIEKIAGQEIGFLNFLRPLMATGLPLMKNVLTPLAKNFFVTIWITNSIVNSRCSC